MQQEQAERLQALYVKYEKVLRFIVYKSGVPEFDISDVVQDTFCSFINVYGEKFGSWEEPQIKALFMKILRNKCADYFRERQRHPSVSMELILEENGEKGLGGSLLADVLKRMEDREDLERLREGFHTLSPEMQKVARLCLIEERLIDEVCEILQISEAACRMRISRIRKHLRSYLEQPEKTEVRKRGRPPGARNKKKSGPLIGEPETG